MLALIVPVTLEKLPAINEKYDMAKALEDNVLQNYVKASTDAKQEKNPDEPGQEVFRSKCLVGDMGYSDGHSLFGRSRLSGAKGTRIIRQGAWRR